MQISNNLATRTEQKLDARMCAGCSFSAVASRHIAFEGIITCYDALFYSHN